jgi:hypothetical protein
MMQSIQDIQRIVIPMNNGHEKIRIGPPRDGGYVVSQECIQKTKNVYSLGIGDGSIGLECGCDLQLAEMGKHIYMYEANYDQPPISHENFHFKRMFVTGKNFEEEVFSQHPEDTDLLLMMDIEGGEYDVFKTVSYELLNKFSQICFEIHWVCDRSAEFLEIINKLNYNFNLIHLHGNNFARSVMGIPDVLELTFVRKDLSEIVSEEIVPFPLEDLDFPNNPSAPELILDWWIKNK